MGDSLDIFYNEMKTSRFFAKIIGIDVLSDENFQINIGTCIYFFAGFIYNLDQIYSCYLFRADFQKFCFCIVTMGYGVQCFALVNVVYLRRHDFWKFYKRFIEFQHEHKHRDALMMNARFTTKINYAVTVTFISVGLVLFFFPIFASIYKNEFIKNCGYYLPYFDPQQWGGYMANLLFEYFIAYFVVVGSLSNCRIYTTMIGHCCTEIDVIKDMLQDLKIVLESNRYQSDKISMMIHSIVEAHLQHFNFMVLLENVGYITLLLQQLSTIFVISTSLLVIITSDSIWYPGYFFLLMSTGPLLLYCVYGTIVETKIDELCLAVYENSWYEMPLTDQKKILFILAATQKPRVLTFGKFSKCNVSTFLSVYKGIYSFVMMLRKTI